ncbi:expressed unknown protein [Seminavis robusta]|uniref:Uncharacterized protein n=1 Tax=Seminavis robusta TaxID=568900 RepID=A0A9N8HQH0_9STRA|nr:expressed unknown protein [Seminavis robusta]|eukprot:Sro1192_g251060.1 n/a (136) ;mRNA; r:15319-15877
MKTALLLSSLLVGASSFAVVPATPARRTALAAFIPEEDMTVDQLEIKKISDKWSEIRHLSREEAEAQLEGDWLEAYNRFYKKYDEDMERMTEIVASLQKSIEPPKVQKKSKGQKRRDAWARVQALQAARAAAAVN